MFHPGRFGLLSIAAVQVACSAQQPPRTSARAAIPPPASAAGALAASPEPAPEPAPAPQAAPAPVSAKPRSPALACQFLAQNRYDAKIGCPAAQFIADEVTLLVGALERDPDWGALISPEIAKEGRFVIVANVVPSLEHFRQLRSNRLTPEIASLVDQIQKMVENQLLRRTATFEQADGTKVAATLQGGQLRGGRLNDYMEYLSQTAQDGGAEPFFIPYDEVKTMGRAARTGLLWTVDARPRPDGSVEVEFGIRTFEMDLAEDGRRLVVRGPAADRTGQLLGALYTVWRGDTVYPLSLTPQVTEAPTAAPAPTPTLTPTPRPSRLRMTVARVRDVPGGHKRLALGAGLLPSSGDLFALVFISDGPEPLAFIFGEALAADAPDIAVSVAGDGSDKSAILGAPASKISLAMTSVFQYTGRESPHVLVLRRNRLWSLTEQSLDKWRCRGEPADGSGLPSAPFPPSPKLISWIQDNMAKQMGEQWSFVEPAATPDDFSGIPVDRIPEEEGALCIWLPFDNPGPEPYSE